MVFLFSKRNGVIHSLTVWLAILIHNYPQLLHSGGLDSGSDLEDKGRWWCMGAPKRCAQDFLCSKVVWVRV